MFTPRRAPSEWRGAARFRFFGGPDPWRTVLFTPSSRLFRILAERAVQRDTGWLRHAVRGDTLVAQVPQSLAVMDAVAAQEPGARLVFVGLCGGLAGVRVGDVVTVSASRALDGALYRSGLVAPGLPEVTNVQAPCLLAGASAHEVLAGVGQTVDLEVGSVLGQAAASGVPAAAVLVVSDLNHDPGVFDSDLAGIDTALRTACATAVTAESWPVP